MGDPQQQQKSPGKVFKCPACGAGFKWQLQFEGRKISCKCGKTFLLKASTQMQAHGQTQAQDADTTAAG